MERHISIDDITHAVMDVLTENHIFPLNEMGMQKSMLSEKYGEAIGSVVDNLCAICLFPDNPTVPHWRNRAMGLCQRFINVDITPISNNKYEKRLKALTEGLSVELNKDLSAIGNHIKSVSDYYANRKEEKDRILLPIPINDCIRQYLPIIKETILQITDCVALQDNAKLTQLIENF